MFCPKCGVYLTENELLRSNVQYMNSVAVEYDARCPNCSMDIGSMRWGKFTVNPDLSEPRYDDSPLDSRKESLLPPPPELRTILRPMRNKRTVEAERLAAEAEARQAEEAARAQEAEADAEGEEGADPDKYEAEDGQETQPDDEAPQPRICPHCGQPMPDNAP